MKYLLILLLTISSIPILGQEKIKDKTIPITVAYFGNYLIQPGLKVGTSIPLKKWEVPKNDFSRVKNLSVSPQLGVFSRIDQDINYLINAEVGLDTKKSNRKVYSSYTIGLGYLIQAQRTSFSINLGSGEADNYQTEIFHFFLPTINYEVGGVISSKLGWYTQFSLGSKLSTVKESSMMLFMEAGMKFYLNQKKNP